MKKKQFLSDFFLLFACFTIIQCRFAVSQQRFVFEVGTSYLVKFGFSLFQQTGIVEKVNSCETETGFPKGCIFSA